MAKRWVATDFGDLDVLAFVDAEVPDPGPGEVTIAVRAAGMNPADYKRFAKGPANDPSALPWPVGYEVSGVIEAVGPDTEIASGGGAVGDEVLAFRLAGGYAERITVRRPRCSPSRPRSTTPLRRICSSPGRPRPRCCT